MFLRVAAFLAGAVGYALVFAFGFFWGWLIVGTFTLSQSAALIAGVLGVLFLCWFARGLARNIIEMFDRDRSTWL